MNDFHIGIEGIFKALHGLNESGENQTVTLPRLYEAVGKAAAHCFPNVGQPSVSTEDWVSVHGKGTYGNIRRNVQRLSIDQWSLAMSNYKPNLRQPRSRKPPIGGKTCSHSAHTSQVAYEECLLRLALNPDGSIVDLSPVTCSWAAGLVRTVAVTAKHLGTPTVLAHPESGQVWLAILNRCRAVIGWPLRIASVNAGVFEMIRPVQAHQLEYLVMTKPCPFIIISSAAHI